MTRHHRIDYLEFTVRDMEKSKAFYGEVFGWQFTDYAPGYSGLHFGVEGEPEFGGFALGEPTKGGSLVVLFSEDLEATLAKIEDHGGAIVKPIFEFPGGRRFHFEDPSGNELAVWTER